MSARPDRARILEAAEKASKAGRLKDALAEYEKLVDADPSDIVALNMVGDLHVRLNQPDKAIRVLQRVAAEYEKRQQMTQALAVLKKMVKLSPDSADLVIRLADLYASQGFAAEARSEYVRVGQKLAGEKRLLEAVQVYEKLVRMDPDDLPTRRRLVDLYKAHGSKAGAVEQLADMGEAALAARDLDAAESVLDEARALDPADARVLTHLVEVYRLRGEPKKGIELLESAVRAGATEPRVFNALGGLYYEDGDAERAEQVFLHLLQENPQNVTARIRLGRLCILQERLDQAYEFLEPLVTNLVKKGREEKAIGLLGLIVSGKKVHLPALEKLASILRSVGDPEKLEVVLRVILDELRKQGSSDRMLPLLNELAGLRPDDEEVGTELRKLQAAMGLPPTGEPAPVAGPGTAGISAEDQEAIRATLSQAELYFQQGLVRNARRILENLRIMFPDVDEIESRIAALDRGDKPLDEEELKRRVEKASALETKTAAASAGGEKPHPRRKSAAKAPPAGEEDKLSTAEIFADTDLRPFQTVSPANLVYYDVAAAAEAEIALIRYFVGQQARGVNTQFEKDLGNIVDEFRKGLKDKFSAENPEIHYQLGLAFMEQGLYAEAVDELKQAARDKLMALECFTIISRCHRLNRDYSEAERWLAEALKLVKKGTDSYYSLEYELALLYEEARDRDTALSLYKDVRSWNPAYRGVAEKVSRLERA